MAGDVSGERSAAHFRRSVGGNVPFWVFTAHFRRRGASPGRPCPMAAKSILPADSRSGDKLCKTAQLVFPKGREEVN